MPQVVYGHGICYVGVFLHMSSVWTLCTDSLYWLHLGTSTWYMVGITYHILDIFYQAGGGCRFSKGNL